MASSSFVAALLLLLVSVVFYQNAVYCAANGEPKQRSNTKQERSKAHEECDIYQGKWVFDGSYPLYEARKCRFILNQFGCQENGRPDSLYLKFRWQPSACNLPRQSILQCFELLVNGAKFLSRFRDKQIMFVGDSIGLNQWESLTCMLHISVPHAKYSLTTIQGLSIFKFHKCVSSGHPLRQQEQASSLETR
ncbi:hypothetical protein V2J09_006409 [Rumex salicifolius]